MELPGSPISITVAAGTPGAASGGSTASSTPIASSYHETPPVPMVQNLSNTASTSTNPSAPIGKPRRPHHKSRTGKAPSAYTNRTPHPRARD